MKSVNPYTGKVIAQYHPMGRDEIFLAIEENYKAWLSWKNTSFPNRSALLHKVAEELRKQKKELSELITNEMGKLIVEAEGEIEKCAWVCDYYAENAVSMLEDEPIVTDGRKSMAVFQPLGPILAVMPWNYPFWQVFRFAAPALMAGNSCLLKHASNVQGCSLAIEKVFRMAGAPENLFRSLIIGSPFVEKVIAHPNVKAVTLTGSEMAGREVASASGKYLKKCVLELGGSDPFIVLSDANLDEAAEIGVKSRMLTSGQTCISAKRFIVDKKVAPAFLKKLKVNMSKLFPGDPSNRNTTLAPLCQSKFVDEIHNQVVESVKMGAVVELGGEVSDEGDCFYLPTILTNINFDMPVFKDETFGPVIAFIEADDENHAIEIANNSLFGLGASIWSSDIAKGEWIGRKIEAGAIFINGMVKSDPRLPFGGIKNSGFGRELSSYGIKEFCNIKSIWIK